MIDYQAIKGRTFCRKKDGAFFTCVGLSLPKGENNSANVRVHLSPQDGGDAIDLSKPELESGFEIH